MNHDPLCVCSRPDHAHFFYMMPADVCMACQCDYIITVRADEREQAAQRVVDLYIAMDEMHSRPPVCAEILAAARGQQS